jgi:4'-phosphopantetheinyl transferase
VIELWRVDLAAWDPSDEALLAPDERARAARFVGERLRRRFVTGRAALRRILGRRLGADPSRLVFGYGAQGKPSLVSGDGISFNVSHSADLMICALADGRRLGVDVEREPEGRELMAIARRHFSARELSEIEAAGPTELSARFNACWTRKEAAIKATGLGISTLLAAFSVPTRTGALRAAIEVPDLDGSAALTLESFDPAPGFAAAVAAEGDDWSLVERDDLSVAMAR